MEELRATRRDAPGGDLKAAFLSRPSLLRKVAAASATRRTARSRFLVSALPGLLSCPASRRAAEEGLLSRQGLLDRFCLQALAQVLNREEIDVPRKVRGGLLAIRPPTLETHTPKLRCWGKVHQFQAMKAFAAEDVVFLQNPPAITANYSTAL